MSSQELLKETVFRLLSCNQEQQDAFTEINSLKTVYGPGNRQIVSAITEYGYLPLLKGNPSTVSSQKYAETDCVKRLINLSKSESKLTALERDELDTVITVLRTLKSKGRFQESCITRTLITECPCHLEVWISLHRHGILLLQSFIHIKQKNNNFICDFSQQITDFAKDLEGINIISEILSELINIGYSTEGESDKTKDSTKTCIAILDRLVKDILHCVLKNEDTQPSGVIQSLCSVSGPIQQVQKSFYSHVVCVVLGYKAEIKVSKAVKGQSQWVYGKLSETLVMFFKQILLVLEVTEIMSFIQQILEQHEVNWQLLLSFMSVMTVLTLDSQKYVLDFTDSLLQEGLEDCDMETTITAILIARHACFQGPHVFMPYADWFQRTFSDSLRSFANSRKSFTFLMKLLTDLAPYESVQHLKVHVLRPPYVPGKCRPILTDYIMLAKTRLQDLQEPMETQCTSDHMEQNTADVFTKEINSAVEAFVSSGKIPTTILEASIFRKPYYIGQFLPALLKPRPLPDMPDDKMKLIAALKKSDKIPHTLYQSYENECRKEAMHLIEGVFVDLDSDDDMELPPLEQLDSSLQHLFTLVTQGDGQMVDKHKHTLEEVISVIASKLEACLNDPSVNQIDQPPIEINMENIFISADYLQVVDMMLNRVGSVMRSVYSSGRFDFVWLTQLIGAIIPYTNFTQSLFKRMFLHLVKQGTSLQQNHIDTLAAIMVEIHLLNNKAPSIMPCGCKNGSGVLLEYVTHHLPVQTGQCMVAALRFISSCLKYVCCSHVKEACFSDIPCLIKKFLYLSQKMVPGCRHGHCTANKTPESDDLHNIVMLLTESETMQKLAESANFDLKEWVGYELNIVLREDLLTDIERFDYYNWIIHQYFMKTTGAGHGCYREAASIMMEAILTLDNRFCSVSEKSIIPINSVERGAAIGLLQQISILTGLFGVADPEDGQLPWLPDQLMKLLNNLEGDIEKQNLVLKFTRFCLSLPAYLLFCDTPRSLTSDSLRLQRSLRYINSVLVTYVSEGVLLPIYLTVYIAQGLVQAIEHGVVMELVFELCPALMLAFVVHHQAVSPFLDTLLKGSNSELQRFFSDMREDSFCVTDNHWLCSCSILSHIVDSSDSEKFCDVVGERYIDQSILVNVAEMLFIQSTCIQFFSQFKNTSFLKRIHSALKTILNRSQNVGVFDNILQRELNDKVVMCTTQPVIKLYPVTIMRFLRNHGITDIGQFSADGYNGLLQCYVCMCKIFEEDSHVRNSKAVMSDEVSKSCDFLVQTIENTSADILRSLNQDVLLECGPLIYDTVLHQI